MAGKAEQRPETLTRKSEPLFAKKRPNMERLPAFGFKRQGCGYVYHTEIVNGQFRLTVSVSDTGAVNTMLLETASDEEYVLHRVPAAGGAFVGLVREEYESVLRTISETCFEPDIFQSNLAKQVIQYARDTYQDELEFLWKRFPDNAILRRKDTQKWYAAMLVVSKQKLGFSSPEKVDILNLRIPPDQLDRVVDGVRFFPGYHMNKRYWYTICLNGMVPVEEICQRIDTSYLLAVD